MALEDELGRPPEDVASEPIPASRKPTEPRMPAIRSAAPAEFSDQPFTVEPEPLREPARPIAQVMSKHAPQVDSTFGAMLKRSLSLRPR
jgi:hypothetical protein